MILSATPWSGAVVWILGIDDDDDDTNLLRVRMVMGRFFLWLP